MSFRKREPLQRPIIVAAVYFFTVEILVCEFFTESILALEDEFLQQAAPGAIFFDAGVMLLDVLVFDGVSSFVDAG